MPSVQQVPSDIIQSIRRWKTNPPSFVTDVFNAKLEPFQREALQALADHGRVSIRSGHGVGKSTLDAWAVLWFLSTHYPAKVPCAAPSAPQINDVLWAELALWYRRMPEGLRQEFELKSDRIELKAAPKESFAVARTGNKHTPEALQGFHSDNLMFVLDEASGIDDVVFQVAEGALSTPGAKVLMTANPTRSSGYFFDSHHKQRHKWHTMRVSCEQSSRVAPDYIEGMANHWGVHSNIYRVRVLGEFPATDDDAVISLELCEEAVRRDVRPIETLPIIWGVDVARFGSDRSAIAKRRGNAQFELSKSWRNKDTMQLSGIIKAEYDGTHKPYRPDQINIDIIGIGAGVVDRCRELGLPVRGINVSESPAIAERYNKLRDELWFKAKEWLEERDSKLLDDDNLIGELTQPKYGFTSSGKLKVEGKDEMKKRGLDSPDIADAWIMTFASPSSRNLAWNRPIKYPDLRKI